jgi:hypothetical protein
MGHAEPWKAPNTITKAATSMTDIILTSSPLEKVSGGERDREGFAVPGVHLLLS